MTDLSTFAPPEILGKPKQVESVEQGVVFIAGAGVFGAWSALKLLRSGYRVHLVDLWGAGNSRSSSGGESRLIRSYYGNNRTYFEMANSSWEQWIKIGEDASKEILHQTGVLWMMPEDERDTFSKMVYLMEENGHAHEVLSPTERKKRFPLLNKAGGFALIEKKAGFLEARKATNVVVEQFIKEGGTFELGEVSIENGEVALNGSQIKANAFLFACGPWLKSLFPFLPLQITRQELYYFGPPKDAYPLYDGLIPWVDWNRNEFYYGIPSHDGRGFKIAKDFRGEIVDPTNMERVPTGSLVEQSRIYLSKRFPFLKDAPVLESRVCQYSNTKDGNFLFDRHPEYQNIWILGGGSGHGFKHGPSMGDVVSTAFQGGEIPATFTLS